MVWRFMWVKNNFQWAASTQPPCSEHENRVIMGVQDMLCQLTAVMEGTQDERLPWYISFTTADMAMGSSTSSFRLSRTRGFQTAGGM